MAHCFGANREGLWPYDGDAVCILFRQLTSLIHHQPKNISRCITALFIPFHPNLRISRFETPRSSSSASPFAKNTKVVELFHSDACRHELWMGSCSVLGRSGLT